MAAAVVGTGIVILAAIWTLALIAAAVLSRSRPPVSFAAPIAALTTAALITALMWLGRTPPTDINSASSLPVVYDYTHVGRLAIVLVTAGGLLGGLGAIFVFHLAVPRRATRLTAVWELDQDDRNRL